MGVVDFSVIVRLGVCHIGMCVMDIKNVLMDLMKKIVVSELKFACKKKAVNFTKCDWILEN